MRLTCDDEANDAFQGERTNILVDAIEIYAGRKLAVISEKGIVSTNRRMSSSVSAVRMLERDGTFYMTKACEVQEGG